MLRKYARLEVLEAWRAGRSPAALRKAAHRVAFEYSPRPGYLYVRSRMISSRTNDNHDTFPADEIEKGYKSFLGKPVFVNHHNANHRRARGVIVAVALHRDRNPDSSPDLWVEGLMELDAVRFPRLAKAIIEGKVNRTSMGVDVEWSRCSGCGNKATSPAEYCHHLPALKGKKIRKRNLATGKVEEKLIHEICAGLSFFENSLLVEDPADPTAYVLGDVDARGLKMTPRSASADPGEQLTLYRGEGSHDQPSYYPKTGSDARAGAWWTSNLDNARNYAASAKGSVYQIQVHPHEVKPSGSPGNYLIADPKVRERRTLLEEKPQRSTAAYLPGSVDTRGLKMAASRRPVVVAAKARPGGDHPFFHANPIHVDHIIAAYHDLTDDEKALGDRWYADAHHVAKAIGGGDAAKGAGLLSAYSPRTAWPVNLFNASRAAQGDPPGPGTGAMGSQQKNAMRILAGKHYNEVLTEPKTNAFAHLIFYGGDTDEDKARGTHKVVIDRHAMSVAMGRRLGDDDDPPLGQKQHYEHVTQAYRDAAKVLSKHYGRHIAPHQVQAGTWLGQIRKNNAEDAELTGRKSAAAKGRATRTENARERWHRHHPEAHPGGIPEENMHHHGQRKLAYGETRVPPQVDTLRMEECPVCGEHDVWSGDRCPVCGFIVPPSLFRDPDVTKAQQVRQELDQQGEVVTQPGAPGDPSTQQIGSGEDADDQMLHPDQLTPDGVPTVQGEGGPVPAADTDGQPPAEGEVPPEGEEEQAEGEQLEEQGEEEQEQGAEDEAEGQELANQGEEDELAPEPEGGLVCNACGATFAPDMAAQPGVPCPACRQGALEPAGGPPEGTGDPSEETEEDEDERDTMPGSKTGATLAQVQAHRIAELSARNEVLEAQLSFLARAAGADKHLEAIRQQVMKRHADMLNPASPIPDPPQAPPTQTTEQALMAGSPNPGGQGGSYTRGTGHTEDDPSRPGTTPGANANVPAAATTTAITPGIELQTPPATNLVDVTAPIQGTNPSQDGGVPLDQRRIETDVRIGPDPLKAHGPGIGGQGDNGSAFPWMLDARQPGGGQPGGQGGYAKAASLQQGTQAPTAADADAARTFGSIRLAKLRITAGMAQGDELTVAERIRADASLSDEMIRHEIEVLGQVRPAAPAPRTMPRQAARQAPSLASVGASAHYASAAYAADDLDGSDIFLD